MAQYHPMPGSDKEPTVVCKDCLGTNVHGEKNAGLPTVPYSAPVVKHTGRLVDSANTKSVQQGTLNSNLRSVRAGRILMAPAQRVSAPPRAYIQMGGVVAAYALSSFFTTSLPGGMVPLSSMGVPAGTRTPFQIERVLKWDAYIYPETDPTLAGKLPLLDKQEILFDFDVDDRGFVYAAYSTFGWGMHRDNGEAGMYHIPQTAWSFSAASLVFVLKSNGSYYAVASDNAAEPVLSHTLFDVTTPGTIGPGQVRSGGKERGIKAWAKDDATQRLAIIDGNSQLRIYDYTSFINGSGPLFGPVSSSPGTFFNDVTYDGSGSFWAVEGSHGFPETSIYRFSSSGSSYVQKSFKPYGTIFKGTVVTAANGYVAVGGDGSSGCDLMLFRVDGGELTRLNLNNFFRNYYHFAPRGYAQPNAGDVTETARVADVQLFKHTNNKLYLIYSAGGIGDVFEVEAGNSIAVTMKTNTFGTVNPNARPTATGPFPGDVVKFTANPSNASQSYRVSWDFGNPTSGQNIAESNTGADVSHQFGGYTSAAEVVAPKSVTATVTNTPSLTDTIPVVLKLPVARIGRTGSTALITATSTGHEVVYDDVLTDASDGSLESHITTWTIDGGTPVKRRPNETQHTGFLGAHTVTMSTAYAAYDAPSLTSLAPAYVTGVGAVTYTVRPFLVSINAAKAGPNAVFSGTERHTTNPGILIATTWSITWTLKDSAGAVLQTETHPSVALGSIPNFTVPMSGNLAGGTVTLTAAVPTTTVGGPAEFASYTTTMNLDVPNPAITRATGECANANGPCTITASSATPGVSMADWTLNWVLQRDGVTVDSGSGNPYKPTLTQPGNYTVTLTAVKGIFEGTATSSFTVLSPVCGPPPTTDQLAITVSCPGSVCSPGATITFKVSTFQYTRQPCDVYKWSIPGIGTKTGEQVTFTFPSANTYTVTLNASNTANPTGSTVQQAVTISSPGGGGNPDPGPTCTRPTGIGITYSGPNCGPGTPCKNGDRINFTATKNNGDSLSSQCTESATWTWGDGTTGSGRVTNHTYTTAGNKTVTVTVTSPAGDATPYSINVPIQNAGCAGSATIDNLTPSFRGVETRCSALNNAFCRRGENIQFDIGAYGYTFQACDQFEWNFGDGGTANTKDPVHAYTGSAAAYTASVRVYNPTNTTGVTLTMTVPFDNAPIQPQPSISVTAPRSAGKGAAVTFTATSDIPATGWVWNFGDGTGNDHSQAGVVGTSSTITHVFNKVSTGQGFNVTVSAKNAQDTTDRSTASAAAQVSVTETPVYRFLLPAVIHAAGQNSSAWRTDVQVYYSAPSPSSEPLNMIADFNGVQTPLLINQSTFIYEDFMRRLEPNKDASGAVIITTQTKYKPQIWTRTYNVDASGRTFGQFIPAVSLDGTTGSSVDGSADPVKYYLTGLRENTRYRTNLGFINPNTTDLIANVVAYDDLRLPLTQFTVTMAPFQLVPINGLGTKIPNIPNRPITLEITVPAGKWLVAYASGIDGVSNDPAYIPAISDAELASTAYSTGIIPGVGHIGDWRSDVTIFNPDSVTMKFDLEYYDSTGLLRGQARDIVLGAGQLKAYDDLLKVNSLWASAPPDGLGMLRVKTTTPVTRYPLSFSRTYNDKGAGGTFGQGIPAFGATNGNVKPGKAAIIPGVRNDANYKTNIGLTNTTANAVNVVVRLLDPNTGAAAREIAVELAAFQSVVGNFDFGGLQTGTFKVEITGGIGEVWAFASIINQGNDPEYVPGIPIQ